MMEEIIVKLFRTAGLGDVLPPVTPVSGGYMHRMFRVRTAEGSYAVKRLNPEVMRRPEAMGNFLRAESLEKVLEEAGIPVVPALSFGGRKMQELDGEYFYIFRWQDGQITDWNHITAEQCRQAGNIQGRIHALQVKHVRREPVRSAVNWREYAEQARRQQSEIAPLLQESLELLDYAQNALNRGRQALPDLECITDGDMDPKNVMWENGKPAVIDLECLDWGNPVSDAQQLSLQWAGITTCSLQPELLRAFFEGYLDAFGNGFRDYGSVLGLAYTWIEWLEYNITRALGNGPDAGERETGTAEVRNTIARIRYLRDHEDLIRRHLEEIFGENDGAKTRGNGLHRSVERMAEEIAAVLDHKVCSIWLYGSVVLEDFRPGWSDIDLLVLSGGPVTEQQAQRLVGLRQAMLEKEPENPYYCAFEGIIADQDEYFSGAFSRLVYWGTSGQRITDKYQQDPFSRYELAKYGRSVYGENDRSIFTAPSPAELREAVRQHYESIRRYAVQTDEKLYSCGWLLDIARCVYTLRYNDVIAKTRAGLWALSEHLFADEEPLKKTLEIRRNPAAHRDREDVKQWLKGLGPVVQQYADVLEKELYADG